MKIFGKRKRKSSDNVGKDEDNDEHSKKKANTESPTAAARTSFASDPIVEELLKTDPKTWNAKQKRMVKRYQQRTITSPTFSNGDEAEATGNDTQEHSSLQNRDQETPKSPKDSNANPTEDVENDKGDDEDTDDDDSNDGSDDHSNDDDDSDQSSSREENEKDDSDIKDHIPEEPDVKSKAITNNDKKSDCGDENSAVKEDVNENDANAVSKEDEIWNILEELNSKMKRTLSRRLERGGMGVLEEIRKEAIDLVAKENEKKSTSSEDKTTTTTTTTGTIGSEDAIWKLLDKLNSKQKRTFTRKLDRDGIAILEEVRKQVHDILGLDDDHKENGDTKQGKRKKRKKQVDLSKLPPEERLRREEQRRLQKEAAERREQEANGNVVSFKHPLNSERRRANRRKPTWKRKTTETTPPLKDHAVSGYLHRKNAKSN